MTPVAGGGVWAVPVSCGLLLAATGAAALALDVPTPDLVAVVLPNTVLGLVLPLIGAAVLSQLPGHPLGRLWLFCGAAGTLTLANHTYAQVALEREQLPLAVPSAWAASWLWVFGVTPLLTFGLLLFPDGRLPSRRWRPLLVLSVAAVALPVLGQALKPGRLDDLLPADNPIGLQALAGPLAIARSAGFVCFSLAVAGGAAALVSRWRSGDAEARQRLALPALSAGLLGILFLIPTTEPLIPWLDAIAVCVVSLVLLSIAVAVLRDQVAGAEVVLRRSLTYGLLTGALAAVFAGGVAALSSVVEDRGADLVATLAVALLALPLRDRLQRVVDRAVYGERADPFAAFDRVQQGVADADDPTAALTGVAKAVQSVLRLAAVHIVVGTGADEHVAAAVGTTTAPLVRFPLHHQDEAVGALLVAPRAGQSALDPRDLRMLGALQLPAAAAVAAVRLSQELQRSRQRIVAAREEERRRLRRDLHDGLGPTLAGIGLGLSVARSTDDRTAVDALLDELASEAATAVVDVRRLVEDLRPPALDELGLLGALRQHVERVDHRDACHVTVCGSSLDGLPAAVEVAAYRIAMEALTNTLRHAGASRCRLDLQLDRGALTVAVHDDGAGLPEQRREGVGMTAMRERATELGGSLSVRPAADGGTTVLARLPLHGA